MKSLLFLAWLALLATIVSAWTKEDYEIFDLVSEVEASEGKGTTFYSWLDVPYTATSNEISKAYRKMSIQMHPDKNPNEKDRYARLTVVATILRNDESRERYDFFYKNGVPKWRGTGYYYSRYRPGLGSVLVFLTMVTSGLQYVVQRMNYKRDLDRIEHITKEAKLAAWGPKMTPNKGQRKVKVNLSKSPIDGRWIEMVVEGNSVYILNENGEREVVNSSVATAPSIWRTWFIGLVTQIVTSAEVKRG